MHVEGAPSSIKTHSSSIITSSKTTISNYGSSILHGLSLQAGGGAASSTATQPATTAVVPWSAGSQVMQLPACAALHSSPFFPVIYSVREPAAAQAAAGLDQHTATTSTASVGVHPAGITSSSSSSSIDRDLTQDASSSSSSSQRPWAELLRSAGAHALGGGIPGSAAMVVQVNLQILSRDCSVNAYLCEQFLVVQDTT
jgi:hypothetical protein